MEQWNYAKRKSGSNARNTHKRGEVTSQQRDLTQLVLPRTLLLAPFQTKLRPALVLPVPVPGPVRMEQKRRWNRRAQRPAQELSRLPRPVQRHPQPVPVPPQPVQVMHPLSIRAGPVLVKPLPLGRMQRPAVQRPRLELAWSQLLVLPRSKQMQRLPVRWILASELIREQPVQQTRPGQEQGQGQRPEPAPELRRRAIRSPSYESSSEQIRISKRERRAAAERLKWPEPEPERLKQPPKLVWW